MVAISTWWDYQFRWFIACCKSTHPGWWWITGRKKSREKTTSSRRPPVEYSRLLWTHLWNYEFPRPVLCRNRRACPVQRWEGRWPEEPEAQAFQVYRTQNPPKRLRTLIIGHSAPAVKGRLHYSKPGTVWSVVRARISDNRENNRDFFSTWAENPHGLRLFTNDMYKNRELTGNRSFSTFSAKSLDSARDFARRLPLLHPNDRKNGARRGPRLAHAF